MEAIMKKLSTGIDIFETLREQDCYYVDKTLLIKEIIEESGQVKLFTRPRRFGKSLNMTMLKSFFEIDGNPALFDGLNITKDTELCNAYMGQYPVIWLTLKGVDALNFKSALYAFASVIGNAVNNFYFLENSPALTEEEKGKYRQLLTLYTGINTVDSPENLLNMSLYDLTSLLCKHFGKPVVLLIDEYDVPLDKAHIHGYYDEMVNLIRNMFHNVLKSNPYLAFAVLTGCLRISKESIFTGLNNLKVYSISDSNCDTYFGFTEAETEAMLTYYGATKKKPVVKEWYDGYRFGDTDMYCPWDLLQYCDALMHNPESSPRNYWINSSGNDLVREFVQISTESTTKDLEDLIAGKSVKKFINEALTYRDLDSSIDNLWSVLYTTGYLTGFIDEDGQYNLRIPNKEVQEIYEKDIIAWFNQKVKDDTESGTRFYEASLSGNPGEMEAVLTELLQRSVSIRDTFTRKALRENFYHGFVLGLLSRYQDIESNSESGNGYSDIIIKNYKQKTAAILELKYLDSDSIEVMEKACQEGLNQIEKQKYDAGLLRTGLIKTILKYGISFNKKLSCVRQGNND